MLTTICIIVAVAILAVLVIAAMKPDRFQISRAMRVNAPPEKIFPLINDLHRHIEWSPFDKDQQMTRKHSGAPAGKGAIYEWAGDRKVGSGRLSISDSAPPAKVVMALDMVKPFQAHNVVEMTMVPTGEATTVTWQMSGKQPFMAKLVSTFVNCDKMVGGQFEKGLADLKAIAER